MDNHEDMLLKQGCRYIVGVDEAGRGPLAGPVVAAAVHIPFDISITGIADSKVLTAKKRKEVHDRLYADSRIAIGVGIVDADEIDRLNILQATFAAMLRAIEALPQLPDHALIDGNMSPKTPIPTTPIVGGDRTSRLIGAASIVAKHVRDEIMLEYHMKWPEYCFESHKGYGTKKHKEALAAYGVLPIHRKSFAPIKAALVAQR